jgi:myo-inositol-1-phosphate synthase
VVIDAVRCCKLAMNHGLRGSLEAPSAYFMKSPPHQYTDDVARELTEKFIKKYGQIRKKRGGKARVQSSAAAIKTR